MEDVNDFDKLLVSYLLKELNAEEEDYVMKRIKADYALQRQFRELEKLWQLLAIQQNIDGISIDEEHMRFKKHLTGKSQSPLWAEQVLSDIKTDDERRRTTTFRIVRSVTVAASVIFLLGVSWLL